MPSNSNGIDTVGDCTEVLASIYQPIHLQRYEEKLQVKNFLKFIEGASNYALYSLQRGLHGALQLCTFDPMVWLPPELLEVILGKICLQDLLALASLNKTWNWYMSSHPVWRKACDSTVVDPVCWKLCRTDADWMVASRDAIAANRALRVEGALVIKKIKVRDLTGHGERHEREIEGPVNCVVAKDGVLCAGFDEAGFWLMHDTTFGRTWALNRGSPVTCFRFIDARNSSKKALKCVGMLLYGTADGTVRAPIEHLLSTRLDYRRHAGSVISCDADMATEILASIGRDYYLRIFSVWSTAMLCALPIEPSAVAVHVLKPHNDHFAVIVTQDNGAFTKYSWPITPGNPQECKTNIETLNPTLNNFYENIYENLTKFGDFLNIKEDKIFLERLDGEEVTQTVVQAESGTIGAVVIQSNEKANAILVYDAYTLRPLLRRLVVAKVSRLVGAGRRFAIIVVCGAMFVDDRLVLVDLCQEECCINTVAIPHTVSHPMQAVHGCPSFQALDFLPVTELRRARLQASHGGCNSRYKRRRCITDGQTPYDIQFTDVDSKRAGSLCLPVDGKVTGRGSCLLDLDAEEMENFSQLEDRVMKLGHSDLHDFFGDRILYTGYDHLNKSLFYVTWNLIAGQKEPRRDKLKGE